MKKENFFEAIRERAPRLQKIINKYSEPNGRINWNDALTDNMDLAEELGIKGNRQRIRDFTTSVSKLRQRGIFKIAHGKHVGRYGGISGNPELYGPPKVKKPKQNFAENGVVEEAKPKKKYTKKIRETAPAFTANLCPNCGCNIAAVNAAVRATL